jgi:subtilisin family serine protease
MSMAAFTFFVFGGSFARLAVAASSGKSIARREPQLIAEVDSEGEVNTRKFARREMGASSSSKANRALSRKEATTKVTTADGALMLGGVPVHNYDDRQPALGSDAAQFLENGGSLTDWVGEVPHVWIAELKPGVTKKQLTELCQQVREMPNSAACGFEGDVENGLNDFTVNCTEKDLESINQVFGSLIESEEADFTVSIPHGEIAYDLSDDGSPSLLEQSPATSFWGLDRTDDQNGLDGTYDITAGGAGVHVYVHDTGIRCAHSEFEGRCIPTLDMSSGRQQECNGNLNCAGDKQGHGSHCAGTVAGRTAGIAKRAIVHAVKVLDDRGSGQQSWSLTAINWLIQNAVHPAVMSASLGARGSSSQTNSAIATAVRGGITVVVAAGNDNIDACGFTPAGAPAAITVGAIQQGDRRASYSNFGRCVDIFGPGSNVRSAGFQSDTAYATLSGTSMACPHVSGAVAVLRASGTSAAQVEGVLKSTSTKGKVTDDRGSPNELLYLAPGGAGPTGPAPSPPPATAPAPAGCRDQAGWA